MAAPPVGARLSRELQLDAAAIRATALSVGDTNPLHHIAEFAGASRFGELIASGAYTSGLLAGLLSEGFGDEAADGWGHVGVDYKVRFIAPVRVDRLMRLEWEVAALEPRRSGTLACLAGRIVEVADGAVAVSAEMTLLYFGPPRPSAAGEPAQAGPMASARDGIATALFSSVGWMIYGRCVKGSTRNHVQRLFPASVR